MLIACDGGAFQPGMSEGIRGCSISFLNAAVEIDPSLQIVLLVVPHDDPRLVEGFSGVEPSWRWTNGRGVVPLEVFPEAAAVRIGVAFTTMNHHYRLGGSFDRAFNRVEAELRKRAGRLALSG